MNTPVAFATRELAFVFKPLSFILPSSPQTFTTESVHFPLKSVSLKLIFSKFAA